MGIVYPLRITLYSSYAVSNMGKGFTAENAEVAEFFIFSLHTLRTLR